MKNPKMEAPTARRPARSRKKLEESVRLARTPRDQALACFELAVFHDNNSREREAIPFYERALKCGLEGEQKAQCLAWLASSLCKTEKFEKAQARLQQARAEAEDAELLAFLDRLERRIEREAFYKDMQTSARLLLAMHKRETGARRR